MAVVSGCTSVLVPGVCTGVALRWGLPGVGTENTHPWGTAEGCHLQPLSSLEVLHLQLEQKWGTFCSVTHERLLCKYRIVKHLKSLNTIEMPHDLGTCRTDM